MVTIGGGARVHFRGRGPLNDRLDEGVDEGGAFTLEERCPRGTGVPVRSPGCVDGLAGARFEGENLLAPGFGKPEGRAVVVSGSHFTRGSGLCSCVRGELAGARMCSRRGTLDLTRDVPSCRESGGMPQGTRGAAAS